MSDRQVKCEKCGEIASRPFMHSAPKGWLFIECGDDADPTNVLIIAACSTECADSLWQRGPGPKWDLDDPCFSKP